MIPASIGSSPAIMRNSVDLPAPFAPTKPIRAPASTVQLSGSNRGRPPKDFVISSILTMVIESLLIAPVNAYGPRRMETQKGPWTYTGPQPGSSYVCWSGATQHVFWAQYTYGPRPEWRHENHRCCTKTLLRACA